MKIYRNGQAIELTEKEICDIYLEARRRNYVDEVVLKLSEHYDIDLSTVDIDVLQIASDVMDEIADNDTIWDCEQEAFHRVIERYLDDLPTKTICGETDCEGCIIKYAYDIELCKQQKKKEEE
jgi:hypothetical protein